MDSKEIAVPEYPVFDASPLDAAFGADQKQYLTREQMGEAFYRGHHPMCKVFSSLFFSGGKLADHGIKFRDSIDSGKAAMALRALMCSFGPNHEIKTGTVGIALANWCEPIATKAEV